MKKSLIALAVLGAMSGAASAQSSVTLYGIVDLGAQWFEKGVNVSTTAVPQYESKSAFGVESGYQSGSRFGLRGSEALGGNWNAVFTLEGGFDASTGQSSQGYAAGAAGGTATRIFGRQSYLGLQNKVGGTFALGRFATPSSGTGDFDLWGFVDPFGTGFGVNGLQSTFIASNALREDNAILWASPSWAGLKFAAMYSGNVSGPELVPNGSNSPAFNVSGQLNWTILQFAITYDQLKAPDTAFNTVYGNPDQKMLQIGGVLNFKILKLHAAWAKQDDIRFVSALSNPGVFNPIPGAPYDNNAYMVGVSLSLLKGTLMASYQKSDADNVNGVTANNLAYAYEPDYSVWGIGWTYPFSRRTNLYIGYGESNWDGNVSTNQIALVGAANRFDAKQFALGLRHLF